MRGQASPAKSPFARFSALMIPRSADAPQTHLDSLNTPDAPMAERPARPRGFVAAMTTTAP